MLTIFINLEENSDNKIFNETPFKENYNNNLNDLMINEFQTKITSDKISKRPNIFGIYNNMGKAGKSPIKLEKTNNKEIKQKIKKEFVGRKRNDSNLKGKQYKYYPDNIIRKIKRTILLILLNFINSSIDLIYDGIIGKGIFIKKLKKLNQRQIIDSKNNKEFLNKTLKDIFSEDITTRITNFFPEHNKILIEQLLNEEDNKKKNVFKNLFSLTFLECLNHIKGSKNLPELKDLPTLDEICQDLKEDDEYVKFFKFYVFNFKEIIMQKKQRNRK